tara:strand:- start:56 stop:307 length:252 start_codon:yes stop_codon:yes gene_type:complete
VIEMTWFDVLKLDPLEYNMRMRDRLATKPPSKPTAEPSQTTPTKQQCDVCGRMKLNVKERADGSTICSVCEAMQRRKDTEATS